MNDQSTRPVGRDINIRPLADCQSITLTEPEDALEIFVEKPVEGYLHMLRYVITTQRDSALHTQEGLMIGQTDSAERPVKSAWTGVKGGLRVLSTVVLGETQRRKNPATGRYGRPSGHVNSDPLVFVNFNIASETFDDISEPD